jgi:deoxyribose-phosphate aldolase
MDINRYLDHTLLRPDAIPEDIDKLCREAMDYRFHSVVVNPVHISQANRLVSGSDVRICSVVAFPLGASQTEIKIAEAITVEADGADEIDIVANIGWLQSRQFSQVARELIKIRRSLLSDTVLKVIIETPLLSPQLWPDAVEAVFNSRAEFVKTATGFFGGTTQRHVEQLKEYCGSRVKLKAAGGIRSAADAAAIIMAGADRIGSSSSVAIMQGVADLKKSDL